MTTAVTEPTIADPGERPNLSRTPAPSAGALWHLVAPVRGQLIMAVVLQAVSAVASLMPYLAIAELGRLALAAGPPNPDRAWTIVGWMLVGLLVRFSTLAAASGITHLADVNLQLEIRRDLAKTLGQLPLGWFTCKASGEIKKTLQDDVAALHHLVGHALTDLTAAIVTPLVALGYLLLVDWRLALLTLVTIPAFVASYAVMTRGLGTKMAQYDAAQARINAAAVEYVQGIAVIKTFGNAGGARRRFRMATDDAADFFGAWARSMVRTEAVSSALVSPVVMLLAVLGNGTWFIGMGWATPADVLPSVLFGLGLTAPILTLGYGFHDLSTARQAANRVAALLNEPPMPEPVCPTVPERWDVEFAGVGFSYDGVAEVLAGVSARLEPGTITALVGPSGSGKSTLAALLPRFHDVTSGRVRVGGVDVREIPASELYHRVGFVLQQVQLLRGTVRDNIALARPEASEDEIEVAARAAHIHDRILELPAGYNTVVGEGVALSGGESQRISIARAILADTPILVLDESTAYADPESEAAIQDAIAELIAGRTVLVVAHRLSTVVGVDQILVLDRGRIIQRGRHEDLVEHPGLYRDLWQAHLNAEATREAGS
ncbi:MAG: ABC transporter ATP-binding protein [Nocardioides sp.]